MQIQKARPGYKLVKSLFRKYEEVPENWKRVKLIENCSKKPEYGAGISAIEKNTELPRYIRITDLNDDGALKDEEWKSISEDDSKDYLLNEGEILFARTGATVGKTYLYQKKDGRCAFAGYLIRFVPEKNQLDSEFLFYYAHSNRYWKWLNSIQTWGVQPNVNAEQYSSMPILLPPIQEQQKIASIFSNVDSLIQQTQKVIEQTQRLKKGLMQKLLKKGIGHNKFKKTVFGQIPDRWDLIQFSEFGKWVGGGTPSKKNPKYWVGGNILWITPKDMKSLEIEDSQDKITKLGSENSFAQLIPKDAILLVVRSGIIAKYFPVAITKKPVTVNQDLKAIILKDFLNPKFLLHLLLFYNNILRLNCFKRGTTVHSMDIPYLRKFSLPIPSKKEQEQIESILSNIDSKIDELKHDKSSLESLKKGLIQKLLTGQIRV